MALSKDRLTDVRDGMPFPFPVAADAVIHAGALVALAAGYAAPGEAATGLVAVGRAEEPVDNTGGDDGDKTVNVMPGIFKWANSADADEITQAEVGTVCYIVDDCTVAKTNGTSSRSVAGVVVGVDADGVLVKSGL